MTERIIQDVIQSLRNRVYNMALVYRDDLQGQDRSDRSNAPVGDELAILAWDLDADALADYRTWRPASGSARSACWN